MQTAIAMTFYTLTPKTDSRTTKTPKQRQKKSRIICLFLYYISIARISVKIGESAPDLLLARQTRQLPTFPIKIATLKTKKVRKKKSFCVT